MASDDQEAEKRILNTVLTKKYPAKWTHVSDVAEWHFERIGVGKGFLSTVYKCTLNRRTSPPKRVCELVLKLPGTATLDANDAYVELLHNRECKFYESIALMDGVRVPRVVAIKEIDKTTGERGFLIIEYAANCRSLTFEESLNAGQIRQLVRICAAIHANALLSKEPWHGREWLKPVNSARFDTDKRAAEAQKRCVRRACKGVLLRPLIALRHLLEDSEFQEYLLNERHKEIGVDSILCHGDVHVDNFMFKSGPEGNVRNEVGAVIDWQLVNEGNPMQDLACFLVNGANADVRRDAEKWVMHQYLARLADLLQRHEMGVPDSFTEEKLRKAYRASLVYHAMRLPKFTVFRTGSASAQQNFTMRTKAALDDAVRIVDEDMPRWRISRLARSSVFMSIARVANRVL